MRYRGSSLDVVVTAKGHGCWGGATTMVRRRADDDEHDLSIKISEVIESLQVVHPVELTDRTRFLACRNL